MDDSAPPVPDRIRISRISHSVLGAAFRVGREMGPGFLENVYENALAIELGDHGIAVEQQKCLRVAYKGRVVGNYFADLLVENCLIVEVKAVRALERAHVSQCVHYLRASGLHVALLLNFGGPSVQYRRIVNHF